MGDGSMVGVWGSLREWPSPDENGKIRGAVKGQVPAWMAKAQGPRV